MLERKAPEFTVVAVQLVVTPLGCVGEGCVGEGCVGEEGGGRGAFFGRGVLLKLSENPSALLVGWTCI